MWEWEIEEGYNPLGYRYLVEKYRLEVPPHHRWSYVGTKWEKKVIKDEDRFGPVVYVLLPSTEVKDASLDHLVFALKHEGVNLIIIKYALQQIPEDEILLYIKKNPKNKYARLIWFYYETLLGRKLALPDLSEGNYIPALDPKEYYTGKSIRCPRYRIHHNFFGSFAFCPLIRKTASLENFIKKDYSDCLQKVIQRFSPEIVTRASQYLFTKETLASWEIEREKPTQNRLMKFTSLLSRLPSRETLSKKHLVFLQKEIVDSRFALDDYRDFQNYVGEEPALGQMFLHYICPRPKDVPSLMEGLLECFSLMMRSKSHPVLIATVLSFGLVLLHPFLDGNGRLHRYLIHYVFHLCGFTPKNLLFPISAAILRNTMEYDQILESISHPLLKIITDYKISPKGEMEVLQETKQFYQYLDFTSFVEYLFCCIEQTISTDFEEELQFLKQYDAIKVEIKEFISMPDHLIDLFLKCLRQNAGKLSQRKYERYFSMLSKDEVEKLENIYRKIVIPFSKNKRIF